MTVRLSHLLTYIGQQWRGARGWHRVRVLPLALLALVAWLLAWPVRAWLLAWRPARRAYCWVRGHDDRTSSRLERVPGARARGVRARQVTVRRSCRRCGTVRHELLGVTS